MSTVYCLTPGTAAAPDTWLSPEQLTEATGEGLCLTIPNTHDVRLLSAVLPRIGTLRLEFPAFADGRAYSQAARLRRLGYRGRLRASGKAVVLDQALELRATGFDEAELRDDQRAADWDAALAASPHGGLFTPDRGPLVNRA